MRFFPIPGVVALAILTVGCWPLKPEADHLSQLLETGQCQLCNLRGARLAGAELANADLTGTQLLRADLAGADLRNATLTEANLREAILTRSLLNGATLVRADLRDANLQEVDLTEVEMAGSYYNAQTQFPAGFDPIEAGMGPPLE